MLLVIFWSGHQHHVWPAAYAETAGPNRLPRMAPRMLHARPTAEFQTGACTDSPELALDARQGDALDEILLTA